MTTSSAALPASNPATPGRWISMGWGVVKEDLGNFILITLLLVVLSLAVSFTVVGHFLVVGPLLTGMFAATRRRMIEGRMEVADLFGGFNLFLDSVVICIITSLFEFVALVLCIFPFFIVGALYLFPYLFLADRKFSFWDALEASRKIAARDLLGYTMFFLLLLLLNLGGLILAGIGVLITIPISVAAISVAYREVVGFNQQPAEPRKPIVIP